MKGFAMSRFVLIISLAFGLFLGVVSPAAYAAEKQEYKTLPLPELTEKAEAGDVQAQLSLGISYLSRRGGIAQDFPQGVNWVRKAAEQGNADAQELLGILYADGLGVSQDYQQAANWYQKAAEQGNAGAQEFLGMLYGNGDGVPKDLRQAAYWLRKAAEQGRVKAQVMLGSMYTFGVGVPLDWALAYALFSHAAANGDEDEDEDASTRKEIVAKMMTPEQIKEGEAIASQWKVGQPFPSESKTGRMNPDE